MKGIQQNRITEGSISVQLLMFFFPIWFGTFFQQMYNTTDAVIVGNFVGKEALAAVGGPTGTIINLLVGFFVGVSSGASVMIAQYFGSQSYENTQKSIYTALAFAVSSGAILMVVGIPLAPLLLKWTGTPVEIMQHATEYLQIYFIGIIFNLLYNVGSGILRAMGDSRRPLYFLIICSICNIVLDILFVVVFHWGVAGVAYATMVSQMISSVLVLISLKKGYPQYNLHFRQTRFHMTLLQQILRVGIPAGLQSVMYSLSNLIIQSGINALGTDTVAAWTAYGKIDSLFWMTISSLGISVTTFVGQNYGAKQYERVRKCIKVSMLMTLLITVMISILLIVASPFLNRIFIKEPQVIALGVRIINLLVPYYFTYIAIEILSSAMRGVGNSLIPMLMTCGGVCVLRVVWMLVIVPQSPTLETVCFSYPFSWAATSAMFLLYYWKGNWMKVEHPQMIPAGSKT